MTTERYPFAVCLTHDVDRPYKTYQSVYEALAERSIAPLDTARPSRNPYWQFDEIMALERELGVRSAFYFLSEPHLLSYAPEAWIQPKHWLEHLGRYDVTDDDVVEVIEALDEGGWEVGLHGSLQSARDGQRLAAEVDQLERLLGHPVTGGRQHHLRLSRTETWRFQADAGLSYDASLGSSTEYGFEHGYRPRFPLDDDFVVFPLTLMETALPDVSTTPETAWAECEQLLQEAEANDAVMTVLWHARYFNEEEFPGYRRLYRRLVERALELGAWVGTPADLYAQFVAEEPTVAVGHP